MPEIKKQRISPGNLLFASVLLSFLSSPLLFAGAPDFPPPPGAAVEWVGKDLEVNGIKSAIRAFHSKKPIEDIVKFYRSEWKKPVEKDKPGFMETIDAAPWYIISRVEDGYLLTVQVQVQENDQSASWGYLSMSPLPGARDKVKQFGASVPKIPGSYVINEMKSDDPGKEATTVIISNTNSVNGNAAFYRQHYQGKGWTTETDRKLGSREAHSLVFKNRRSRVTIMLLEDKNFTRIVINAVKNSVI